jgi:hypothetical protein
MNRPFGSRLIASARIRRAAICAIAALAVPPQASAHEIGTTRVAVVFQQDDTFEIEIVTDAASLVEKLDAMSPAPTDLPTRPGDRLRLLDELFRERVAIEFDGDPVRPTTEYAVSAATPSEPAVATIRMRGTIPEGARQFTWRYGWTLSTYAMTVRRGGTDQVAGEWLEGDQASTPVALAAPEQRADRMSVAIAYLALGFTHVVPGGLDHVLFVIGLFLLSRRPRLVLVQASAFTIAHSITLALSVCSIVSISPRIVEPLIALSIACVALENVFKHELSPWRVARVSGFGLLHGLGFAGALQELGLPRTEFVAALVSFNVGVEAGQLAAIGAVWMLVGWWAGPRAWYRRFVVVPASMAIACTAIYWTIERIGFLG